MRKDERLSPMYTLYKEFEKILKKITIKFGYLAEKYETVETLVCWSAACGGQRFVCPNHVYRGYF